MRSGRKVPQAATSSACFWIRGEQRSVEGGMFPPSRSSCLSRDEKTSRNNPKSIYSDEGKESRDIFDKYRQYDTVRPIRFAQFRQLEHIEGENRASPIPSECPLNGPIGKADSRFAQGTRGPAPPFFWYLVCQSLLDNNSVKLLKFLYLKIRMRK